MVTKELVKFEIDHLQDEDWEAFVDRYAGCLKEAPLERGEQGTYDVREELQ